MNHIDKFEPGDSLQALVVAFFEEGCKDYSSSRLTIVSILTICFSFQATILAFAPQVQLVSSNPGHNRLIF